MCANVCLLDIDLTAFGAMEINGRFVIYKRHDSDGPAHSHNIHPKCETAPRRLGHIKNICVVGRRFSAQLATNATYTMHLGVFMRI